MYRQIVIKIMPNWCTTTYRVMGDSKSVNAFQSKLMRLAKFENLGGMGVYIGNFFDEFNASQYNDTYRAFIDIDSVDCIDGETLEFTVTSAYRKVYEVEEVIESNYPMLSIYYIESELGMCVFNTNDYANSAFSADEIAKYQDFRYDNDDCDDCNDDCDDCKDDCDDCKDECVKVDEFKILGVEIFSMPVLDELHKNLSVQLPLEKFNKQGLILNVYYKVNNKMRIIHAFHYIRDIYSYTSDMKTHNIRVSRENLMRRISRRCTNENQLRYFMSDYTKQSLKKMLVDVINKDVTKNLVSTYKIECFNNAA